MCILTARISCVHHSVRSHPPGALNTRLLDTIIILNILLIHYLITRISQYICGGVCHHSSWTSHYLIPRGSHVNWSGFILQRLGLIIRHITWSHWRLLPQLWLLWWIAYVVLGHRKPIFRLCPMNIINIICVASCYCWLCVRGLWSINRSYLKHVPPWFGLQSVNGFKGIARSFGFEFINHRRIYVFHIYFVVNYICNPVLF